MAPAEALKAETKQHLELNILSSLFVCLEKYGLYLGEKLRIFDSEVKSVLVYGVHGAKLSQI